MPSLARPGPRSRPERLSAPHLAGRLLAAFASLSLAAVLAGCATPSPQALAAAQPPVDELFVDAAFAPPDKPIDVSAVMALDEGMREAAHHYRSRQLSDETSPPDRMLDGMFARGALRLEYDATRTRTAREAWESRSGNCLSLVLLTAAFARELDLDVTFQSVETDDYWSRDGDLYALSGHVNVVLGHRFRSVKTLVNQEQVQVIDFLPPSEVVGRRTHEISERTVLAMFMNNRAAESIAEGHLDTAYWHAREAVRLDPAFVNSYITLSVVYLRHHDPVRAERALRRAAALAPDSAPMLANLAEALRQQGRVQELSMLDARLHVIEPYPPFHFFTLGQRAMSRGDWIEARADFQRELARQPDYHEFHFWLAQAELHLGDVGDARRHLALAMQNSTRRGDHDLYAAKLDHLQSSLKP